MFAYFTKINDKDIIDYTHNMVRLYLNEDDSRDEDGNEYLFNTQTIANWANEYNAKIMHPKEIVVSEDVPPLFSYV